MVPMGLCESLRNHSIGMLRKLRTKHFADSENGIDRRYKKAIWVTTTFYRALFL